MDYQAFALQKQKDLLEKNEWGNQYLNYANALISNEFQIKERRKAFHKVEPLQVYTTIGMAKENAYSFDMRYLGQSVATINVGKAKSGRLVTLSTKSQHKNNKSWFNYDRLIDNEDWHNSQAAKEFRQYFKSKILPSALPRQKEHMWESRIFSELEKPRSVNKAICGIQPVSFAGSRFHMKTAIKGSSDEKDVSNKGGEIDVFCRQKIGNKLRLSVIEVKDENKTNESLEKTMIQALAYTVFIRELLRYSKESGRAWLQIWGVKEDSIDKHLDRPLEFNSIVAMPFVKNEIPDFLDKVIMLGDDKIFLRYMLVDAESANMRDVRDALLLKNHFNM